MRFKYFSHKRESMPRKSDCSEDGEKRSSLALVAVKKWLQSGNIPEAYNKNDKRALLRRAKSFVLVGDDLYFTGGRSRHNKGLFDQLKNEDENPENEPDYTQTLRKVLFTEDDQQEAVNQAHVAEDGLFSTFIFVYTYRSSCGWAANFVVR
jgi:hypothetical protein